MGDILADLIGAAIKIKCIDYMKNDPRFPQCVAFADENKEVIANIVRDVPNLIKMIPQDIRDQATAVKDTLQFVKDNRVEIEGDIKTVEGIIHLVQTNESDLLNTPKQITNVAKWLFILLTIVIVMISCLIITIFVFHKL